MTFFMQSVADSPSAFPMLGPAFLSSLLVDVVCVFVLTRLIYYRHYKRSDLFLTFVSFNLVIFLIAYSLSRVEMTLGAAFGLFAVFSMLRYRTSEISAKDMTYMFMVIALGLLMAIGGGNVLEKVMIGGILLASTVALEANWIVRREHAQDVLYDRVDLVKPASRAALLEDLRARTGLDVHRVDVRQVDFLRDAAELTLYHHVD